MSNRYSTLTVALEQDISEEEAKELIAVIKLLRGVADVSPNVADYTQWLAQVRVRRELGEQLLAVVFPKMPQGVGR